MRNVLDIDKVDCVGAFDCAITLCKATDFLGIGVLPYWAFTALSEFAMFGDFSCIRVDCMAVECKVRTFMNFGKG